MLEDTKNSEQLESEFLATARKRFDEASADEAPIRKEAAEDLRFIAGDQWNPRLKADRLAHDRPVLTFNRMHTFVQQISNEARQMRGEIKFVPNEDGDQDEAEMFEGIVRHIQYNSRARVAYETAVDYSAGCSFGYYVFEPQYVDDKGWDQEIVVTPVFDPFSIYGVLIPACFGQKPQFAFWIEKYTRDEYKAEFKDSEVSSWDEARIVQDGHGWITKDEVRVARYYYIEEAPETIERIVDGTKETRVIRHKKVKCCKINGVEKLPDTETEWPGARIPVWPVLGKCIINNGQPQLFSAVRFQRDPQQLLNGYRTREAEIIGKSPISPFMAAVGQIPSEPELARAWEEAANGNVGVLLYNLLDINGKPAPLPQRQTFEPPIGALSAAAAQMVDEMKATAGIYDASLGARGNETSGLAIQRRQQQSGVTNMHFLDNLERSFGESGPELARVLPIYYDGPRTVRIMGRDEVPKIAKINQEWQGNRRYDIGKNAAKYDVIVTMGRSYSTKRMESFDMIGQIVQASPEQLPIIGDVMFKNSDMAGSEILAERYHKMLPPQLQDQNGDPNSQIQQLQGQLQQASQHLKAIDAFARQLQQEKETKVLENQAKSEIVRMQEMSRLEIVKMQEATKLAVAQINASKDANQAYAEGELEQYKLIHGSAHEAALQAQNHAHEAAMAQQETAQNAPSGE